MWVKCELDVLNSTIIITQMCIHHVPTASIPVQQYFIARDRERRTIKPPHKYGEANLVAYALSVVDNIDSSEESFTYEEAY